MSSCNPIPWVAINEYALRYNIHGDEFEIFNILIRRMDEAFLNWANNKKDG